MLISRVIKNIAKHKKKIKLGVSTAHIYVQASFNNTLISLADINGNILTWCTAGKLGFGGARKATPHAATQVMLNIIDKMKDLAVQEVIVKTNGVGTGREAALRALASSPVNIKTIIDLTPMPHNGPRPKKARRV